MSYYKLYRFLPDGNKVRGVLYLCQPGRRNETLLVKAADTLENLPVIIPALVYPVCVTMSPRFGKLLPLLRNVPGRSGIRIHGGTKPEHSQGCVLITRKTQYQAVVERMLYEQKRHEDIRIEIIQMRPGDRLPTNQTINLKYTDYEKIPTQITQSPAA